MVDLQILNKILLSGSLKIIDDNFLTAEYFPAYEAEYLFIVNHFIQYGKTPDKHTVIDQFPDFSFIDVMESDTYLVDKIREERLYSLSTPVVQEYAELLKQDAVKANEFLSSKLPELTPAYGINGTDLISTASQRFLNWKSKQEDDGLFIPTGFSELDRVVGGGWSRQAEELVLLFARTGQGKSWVLDYCIVHAWKNGFKAGIFTPEMSKEKVGYRLDTLMGHFSNRGLLWGSNNLVQEDAYSQYTNQLSSKSGILAVDRKDFGGPVTVNKLKGFIRQNNLDILGIDGITYVNDERAGSRDLKRVLLGNVCEDLVELSNELKVPILAVHQSNRSGVRSEEDDGLPDIENLAESDAISHNSTKIIAIRQQSDTLTIGLKKHRDGASGAIFNYGWDIDSGRFMYKDNKAGKPKKENDADEPVRPAKSVSKAPTNKKNVF